MGGGGGKENSLLPKFELNNLNATKKEKKIIKITLDFRFRSPHVIIYLLTFPVVM